MRCEEVRDELAAFLDGELTPEVGTQVLAHLEGCSTCRDERAVLERTRERVRSLPRVVAPAALLAQVATRLAAAAGRGPCPGLDAAELSAFLDAELEATARARVVAHLETCPSCRGDLVALDSVVSGVQNLPRIPAPEILAAIVRERIALLAEHPGASPHSGQLGRGARKEAARSAASRRSAATPTAPAAPRVPREPIQIPLQVRRVLAAASIAILALGAIPFAMVNASPAPTSVFAGGFDGPTVAQSAGRPETPAAPPPAPRLPKPLERDRTLFLVADATLAPTDNLDGAVATARTAFQLWSVAFSPTRDPAAFVVRGTVPQLRGVFTNPPAGLTLEDASNLDELLPPPLDRVYGRNGEVYAGLVERQDASGVVLRSGSLTLELPARSCVRIEPASRDPIELGLGIRRRRSD